MENVRPLITPGGILVAGAAEGMNETNMQAPFPYTPNWNTNIWQFAAGQYPTLKNNPE
jgi:hypothetical protein